MKTSLDKRITLATFLVATLVMALFAVIIAFASSQIEHGVLDQMVVKEFGEIQRKLARGEPDPLPQTAQMHTWLTERSDDKGIPEEFRHLPSGIHHEIRRDRSQYHVLRESVGNDFLTLAYEINLVESRELQFKLLLLAMVLTAPLMVMWFSFMFTRRMTRPVTKLAEKLRSLDPNKRNMRLGSEFEGEEVEAIADAFDRYQERLDLMVEREQSFSAAASHELRSPLAVINACTELLQSEQGLSEPGHKQVARISKSVGMMSDVVNSLLAISRGEGRKTDSPLHIQPVLEEAIANYRSESGNKQVAIDYQCDEELTLWIPMGEFLIILGNLIQNAVRNTEKGSIGVYCDNECLTVTDTGRGMPRDFARHIFDKHVQAHDSHGAGLGLHIVKRLCDRYGWDIQVESEIGQGTTVTVRWKSSKT